MSDDLVEDSLRTSVRRVLVEAPAGCGKTHQAARYARDVAPSLGSGRVLLLAHTHAACDVFASRTRELSRHIDVRTIDSLVVQIATIYHPALDLPEDVGGWARREPDGYAKLAGKVARLVASAPMISRALAFRYPVVICDEHQDASADEHALVEALERAGSRMRIFWDPMQRIYGPTAGRMAADEARWQRIADGADADERLEFPHRWKDGSLPLGQWILEAREELRRGGCLDLRGQLPTGLTILFAENIAPRHGGFQLAPQEAGPIYAYEGSAESLLVLGAHRATVHALRAFFGRRMPIWEGHVRDALSQLVADVRGQKESPEGLARAAVTFLGKTMTGFSPASFGNCLIAEAREGCVRERRGKPALLQELARLLVDEPDHRGVAKLLSRVAGLRATERAFSSLKIDYPRELQDAIALGRFDDPDEGCSALHHRRAHSRSALPNRAISTIHKSKGHECKEVLVLPCDRHHLGNSKRARCLLYVAMSRATHRLTLVVSRSNPSPLVAL